MPVAQHDRSASIRTAGEFPPDLHRRRLRLGDHHEECAILRGVRSTCTPLKIAHPSIIFT